MILYKIIKKIPTWLTTVVVVMLITYISLDKNPFNINQYAFMSGMDKVVHGIMYFALASALIFDLSKVAYPFELDKIVLLLCVILAALYGTFMESVQGLIDLSRDMSLGDMLANFIGAVIGLLFMKFYLLKRFDDIMRS